MCVPLQLIWDVALMTIPRQYTTCSKRSFFNRLLLLETFSCVTSRISLALNPNRIKRMDADSLLFVYILFLQKGEKQLECQLIYDLEMLINLGMKTVATAFSVLAGI